MSLTLIYGRAGSGKSTFCLNQMNEGLSGQQKNPLILLVPEQYSLQAEENLVKVLDSGGSLQAEVLTFRRLAYRIFNETGGLVKPRISLSGKSMLVFKIMEGLKGDLHYFSKAALKKGFVNTFLKTVTEFKRYGITDEILGDLLEDLDEKSLLKAKLTDIREMFCSYNSFISENFADADDDLTLLADKLNSSEHYRDAEFWIDGFSGFTPQEYAVIEKLLSIAKNVYVTLCADINDINKVENSSVFKPLADTARKLARLAEKSGINIERPIMLHTGKGRFSNNAELMHLERSYFSYPFTQYSDKPEHISLFSSLNIYSEVEHSAKSIINLCREKGYRFKDISIVTRELDTYEKLIGAIFTQYDIPFFLDRKKEINNHPLIQLVLAVNRIFTENWSYEAVLTYLKTGMTGLSIEYTDLLENYVLANGIKGKRWTTGEPWESEAMEELRKRITEPLLKYRQSARGRKAVTEFSTAMFDFLQGLGIEDRLKDRLDWLRQIGELDAANELTQVWNSVMEVLDQAVDVYGSETVNIERFCELLEAGFSEYKAGLIPPSLDQVIVGSIDRSKSHNIKVLFVLGVNDGVFPAAAATEGILSDNDRTVMRSIGVELAQDTRSKIYDEQFLIYTTLTTPSDMLNISWSISDSEGKTLRPSIIISRLKKIFPGLEEQSNVIVRDTSENALQTAAAQGPAFNGVISAARRLLDTNEINDVWYGIYSWFKHDSRWNTKLINALQGLSYSNKPDKVSSARIKELFGSPMLSSVSRMEKYASCPFSHFIEYGLKAREREILRIETPDIGTFMHDAIDRFSDVLQERKMTWREFDREWASVTIRAIVDDMLGSSLYYAFRSSKRYIYLVQRLKNVLERAVWLISEHFRRSSFEPLGYEIEFSEKGDFPAIDIAVPSGETIRLVGRIDRLDTMKTQNGTFLRIIDYKSGNKALKLNEVFYGLKIQLLTYLDALSASEGSRLQQPLLPGGILYFRLEDPLIKGKRDMSEDDIEKAILKQLRMKGILLADVNLIKAMDNGIDGESLIIPARINKDEQLGRSSAVTLLQFEKLRQHVRSLLTKMGDEMYNGNVEISPFKKKQMTACTYCKYLPICQFDTSLKGNKFRILNEMKDEEVWPMLEGGESNE